MIGKPGQRWDRGDKPGRLKKRSDIKPSEKLTKAQVSCVVQFTAGVVVLRHTPFDATLADGIGDVWIIGGNLAAAFFEGRSFAVQHTACRRMAVAAG